MKVSAHQPCFLPWVGYWHKILTTDVFLCLSGAKFSKGDYVNRVKLQGSWLTVPVVGDGAINQVQVGVRALKKLSRTLQQLSKTKYPYHLRLEGLTQLLEDFSGGSLAELNLSLQQEVLRALGASPVVVMVDTWPDGETPTERLKTVLHQYAPGISEYGTGVGALSYLDVPQLGVPVACQEVVHPYSGDSVVQLIASVSDPVDLLLSCARWK